MNTGRTTKPEPVTVTENRVAGEKTYIERHPDAKDFYNQNDDFVVNNKDLNDYATWQDGQKSRKSLPSRKPCHKPVYLLHGLRERRRSGWSRCR